MSKRGRNSPSDPLLDLATLKRLAIIALFSDDEFFQKLVLKGGSAIDLLYNLGTRSSIDLDFSIDGDLLSDNLEDLQRRFAALLSAVFRDHGLQVFDVVLTRRPERVSPDLESFWGGYTLEFKLLAIADAATLADDLDAMRRQALVVGPSHRRTFEVDLSRHEFCTDKEEHRVNGFAVFVYTPRLIVAEKLRAICQQMPEYRASVRSRSASARARDFFDIHELTRGFSIVTASADFFELLGHVFAAKRVPLDLLWKIANTADFHRSDFESVQATVVPGVHLEEFDFYFQSVVMIADGLKPFRNK